MKGFVFTLDALFALIVAGVGVSMLMYLQYSSQGTYQTPLREAYSLLQSTLQESVGAVCQNVSLGAIYACQQVSGMPGYSFGAYTAQPYQSVLQAMANMYINPQYGPFATALLNAVYPSINASIFINGAYAPSINLQSAVFDGSSSRISIGTASLGTGSVTVSAWVYSNGPQLNGMFNLLYGPGLLIYWGTSGVSESSTFIGFRGYNQMNAPSGSLSSGTWHHIIYVYNGQGLAAPANYQIYIDGVSQTVTASGGNIGGSTSTNYIGSDQSSNFFSGLIANVQIYNAALTASQVQQLYKAGIAGAPLGNLGLAGWWSLDGNANDYSINRFASTPTNVIYSASLSGAYVPSSLSVASRVSKASVPMMLNVSGTTGVYNVSMVVWR